MKIIILLFIFLSLILSFSSVVYADNQIISDVSWPNCKANLSNIAKIGIVGVNGGLDYSYNSCLFNEVQVFHNSYALYLNTGYPGNNYGLKYQHYPKNCRVNNYLCLAYNYGYNDALKSIKYASSQDTHSFVWWLDVETDNSWTNNYQENRASLQGMINALKKHIFMPTIGFYSYPAQWILITKNWQNHSPIWVATALTNKKEASAYCNDSFNSGFVWLTQYTTKFDFNYSCLPKKIYDFKIRISGK